MADEAQDGEADPDPDTALEVPDDGDSEDEAHEEKFRPAADLEEELDVVWCFFDQRVGDDRDHGAQNALGEVVEIRKEKDGGEDCDDGEEDVGHGCQTAGAGVDFGTSIATEGGECHEETACHVRGAEGDEFAVCAEGKLYAILGVVAAS